MVSRLLHHELNLFLMAFDHPVEINLPLAQFVLQLDYGVHQDTFIRQFVCRFPQNCSHRQQSLCTIESLLSGSYRLGHLQHPSFAQTLPKCLRVASHLQLALHIQLCRQSQLRAEQLHFVPEVLVSWQPYHQRRGYALLHAPLRSRQSAMHKIDAHL